MSYFVKFRKPNHNRRKLTPRHRVIYHKEPTLTQRAQREKVVQIAKWYKGQSTEKLCAKLAELGYYPTDKRIYKRGGVGSWVWLPKLAVYRIQVRATHCSTKGAYMPYALCVEV
jgi:hypothetical protein